MAVARLIHLNGMGPATSWHVIYCYGEVHGEVVLHSILSTLTGKQRKNQEGLVHITELKAFPPINYRWLEGL